MPANPKTSEDTLERADDFKPGPWKNRINVRDRIQRNYTPYEGDASFVAGATERTRKVLMSCFRCWPRSGRRACWPPCRSR